MKTNELKKGTRIKLRNGWEADIMDNQRGNTRICRVFGDFDECGSVYAHDIVGYRDSAGGWHDDIEYTDSQLKCRKAVKGLFGG